MKKHHFYEGMTPTPNDFDILQQNTEDALHESTHAITGTGVLSGLTVSMDGAGKVVISAGDAVAPNGQRLALTAKTTIDKKDGLVVLRHSVVDTTTTHDIQQKQTWKTRGDKTTVHVVLSTDKQANDVVLAQVKNNTIDLTPRESAHGWNSLTSLRQQLKSELMAEITKAKTEAQNAITQAKKDVLNSAIPIGFIYTQFPNQPTPQQLWGNTMTWQNISSQYADCFFRAEGRDNDYYGAKKFQTGKQTDAIRDFTFAFKTNLGWGYGSQQNMSIVDQGDDWGWSDGSSRRHSDRVGYRFSVSTVVTTAAENRPVNYTVRIWKRTA